MSEMLLVIIDGKRVYDNLEFEDDQVFTVIYTALLIMVLIIAMTWSLKMIRGQLYKTLNYDLTSQRVVNT